MPSNNNQPATDELVPITNGNGNAENNFFTSTNGHSYTVTYTSNNQPPPPHHLMQHHQLHHLHQQFHIQLHAQIHNQAQRPHTNEITERQNL